VHGYYTALLAHAVMFGVGWVASALLPRRRTLEAATEAIGASPAAEKPWVKT
jgi:hypothetical protein